MKTAIRVSCAVVVLLSATALAQTDPPSPLSRNTVEHFAAIWPAPPKSRDVTFLMPNGLKRPARQFYVDQGNDHFSVTLVKVPEVRQGDKEVIDYAADQIKKKGMVRFNFHNCYDPGVPGQQINLAEANGNQLRASVYVWDHQLYITEASAMPGSQAALQFEQSITILDDKGEDLNTGQGSPPC
jgi:hypothetical protein